MKHKKTFAKVPYIWQFGFFSLQPPLPKQTRIENSYYRCGSKYLCLLLCGAGVLHPMVISMFKCNFLPSKYISFWGAKNVVTILQNLLLLNYCSSKGCKQSALKKVVMMVPTVWGAYGCGVPFFVKHLKILKIVDHDMFCLHQQNPVYLYCSSCLIYSLPISNRPANGNCCKSIWVLKPSPSAY